MAGDRQNTVWWNPYQNTDLWAQRRIGEIGKGITKAGEFASRVFGQDVRLGPGGSALGASLQSYGGQNYTPPGVSYISPAPYMNNSLQNPVNVNTFKTQENGDVLGDKTTQNTGGGGGGGPAPTPTPISEDQDPSNEDIYATLDREFGAAIVPFEQSMRAEAQTGQEAVETQGREQKTALRTQEKGAMGKARQLYNELVGQGSARLSALGSSSSSAAEAYGEMAGRRMQEQVATIQNAVMQEAASIDNFVRTKTAQFITDANSRIAQAKSELMSSLANLKAQDRLGAVKAYRDLEINVEEYKRKLGLELQQYQQKKQIELANRYKAAVSPYNTVQPIGPQAPGSPIDQTQQYNPSGLIETGEEDRNWWEQPYSTTR